MTSGTTSSARCCAHTSTGVKCPNRLESSSDRWRQRYATRRFRLAWCISLSVGCTCCAGSSALLATRVPSPVRHAAMPPSLPGSGPSSDGAPAPGGWSSKPGRLPSFQVGGAASHPLLYLCLSVWSVSWGVVATAGQFAAVPNWGTCLKQCYQFGMALAMHRNSACTVFVLMLLLYLYCAGSVSVRALR